MLGYGTMMARYDHDVVGLQDQQLIEELQDSFHTALHNYIMTKAEKDNNRFGHILLRLPELRSIGTKSLERMFMLKFTGQIHPGRVLSELLHSAKR
ncbi:hypothetical protein QZH41_018459 [Actinostola sp. cb2023]|nr:hypothetical protein QZH41_018459 [Actinostola sp. cb2023]